MLGAEVGPYLAPLAAAMFHEARKLLGEGKSQEADKLLANIEAKYADTVWFALNKPALDSLQAQVMAGEAALLEAEADKLYLEAVRLFKKRQLFDLKPVVEKLKAEYPKTAPVTDNDRDPSFAEMEEAVADLGEFLTVRLNGKGDFRSVQEAIDAARPHSLIQIEDDGPYAERLVFPGEKPRLTVRGKKGCWPVITSLGLTMPVPLVEVKGSGIALERLVLLHAAPTLAKECLVVRTGGLRLASSAVLSPDHTALIGGTVTCEFEESLLLVPVQVPMRASMVSRNCVVLGRGLDLDDGCEFQSCTLLVAAKCNVPSVFRDSIVTAIQDIDVRRPWHHTVETCNVIGQAVPENAKGCLSVDPQFVNPRMLDYRLMPTSPCIGKASDGGDIGCRYTPEMIELCEKALELRRQGILKF